jgi:hypothetical protein
MSMPSTYGEFTGAPKVEVLEVINKPEAFLKKTVAIEGEITKQCTSMGCYFFFAVGDKELRVDLADVAMNAPKGKNGRRARVEGRSAPYDHAYQFMASAVEFQ